MIISIISNHLSWLLTNFVISFLYGNWDCGISSSHRCIFWLIIGLGNFPTEQKHSFLFRKGLRVIGQPLLSTNNNILIPHGPVINDTYTYNDLVGWLKMKAFHADDLKSLVSNRNWARTSRIRLSSPRISFCTRMNGPF